MITGSMRTFFRLWRLSGTDGGSVFTVFDETRPASWGAAFLPAVDQLGAFFPLLENGIT